MRMEPMLAAERIIEDSYPDCLLAVLGGSAGRGEFNEFSDLDIAVVKRDGEELQRRTIEACGWVVELFLLPIDVYRTYFDHGIMAGNPTLQRIIAEGKVIRRTPDGDEVLHEAQSDLRYGPLPLVSSDIDAYRYMLTEYIADLRSVRPGAELWFTVQKITTLLCEFVLRVHNQWTGEGKTLFRLLSAFDPDFSQRLEQAMEAIYHQDEPAQLMDLCADTLNAYGGFLLVGYEE
ncbi:MULTISPECIES: nucleotidyltransferase domain-containing protein [Paenibacillus]|uniref:Nucleotidyltransferase domain-containing protein n=1 Tax=Paenibacillus campinasensis TaxID=66347 RepID=A0ABW9T3T0_9BACL|nr:MULTISPECIES: nucleotidyltransferase domain-containing protein [Paenibacillus]MUG66286.1 nucleotidyltransferase domain-containing protein [Paenibacillus campinasensis]PAK54510.1 hypothetical protein CHH75_06550 [Paenibacillus sp. 7541]